MIGGANVLIDQSSYEIKGPIDSKVRLEYLFCTGEMFLPNYESNKMNKITSEQIKNLFTLANELILKQEKFIKKL